MTEAMRFGIKQKILLVLVGMLTFLANYYLNAFRKPSTAD